MNGESAATEEVGKPKKPIKLGQINKELTRIEQMARKTRGGIRKRRRSTERTLEEVAEKSVTTMIKNRPVGMRKMLS